MSSELTTYIQELKNQLKNKVGVTKENEKEFYLLENINAVNKLFVVEGKGEELLLKLKGFKKEILNVDPKITRVFEDKLIITSEGFESSENSQKDFSKTFFNHLPAVGALVLLSKFENNVLIIENQFVTFCNFQQSYRDIFFSTFNTLIGQSSNYLKGGDELEITAGVGAFSTTNNPKITVNDKLIPLENGVAIYKIKAQLKAGKYFIPVKIEYITEDGRKEVVTKNISYTVIE